MSSKHRTTLVIRVEAADLFVQGVIRDIGSLAEARRIAEADPTISIQNARLYVQCSGFGRKQLFETQDSDDECGRWFSGANRESLEDLLDSSMGLRDFLSLNPVGSRFVLVWYGITEYSFDEKGNCQDLIASTSAYIGIPA